MEINQTSNARLTVLIVCVISIAMVAAGCGGESGDDASGATGDGTTELSKASYLKQANAACRKAGVGLEEEVADFVALQQGRKPPPLFYADLAHYVLLPKIEDEMEAVRALGAPPGEEREIDHLLYMREAPLNQIAVSRTVASLEAVDRMFVESSRLLREYGLPSCAKGPEAKRLIEREGT